MKCPQCGARVTYHGMIHVECAGPHTCPNAIDLSETFDWVAAMRMHYDGVSLETRTDTGWVLSSPRYRKPSTIWRRALAE